MMPDAFDQPVAATDAFSEGEDAFGPKAPTRLERAKGIASEVWGRLQEPVKMEEISKIPILKGLGPELAEALRTRYTKTGIPISSETSWFDKEVLGRAAAKSLTDWYSPLQFALRGLSLPAGRVYQQAVKELNTGNIERAAQLFARAKLYGKGAAGVGVPMVSKQIYDYLKHWDTMTTAEKYTAAMGIFGGVVLTGYGFVHGTRVTSDEQAVRDLQAGRLKGLLPPAKEGTPAGEGPVVGRVPIQAPQPEHQIIIPENTSDRLALQNGVLPMGAMGDHYLYKDPQTGASFSVHKSTIEGQPGDEQPPDAYFKQRVDEVRARMKGTELSDLAQRDVKATQQKYDAWKEQITTQAAPAIGATETGQLSMDAETAAHFIASIESMTPTKGWKGMPLADRMALQSLSKALESRIPAEVLQRARELQRSTTGGRVAAADPRLDPGRIRVRSLRERARGGAPPRGGAGGAGGLPPTPAAPAPRGEAKGPRPIEGIIGNVWRYMMDSGIPEIEQVGDKISFSAAERRIWVGRVNRQVASSLEGLSGTSRRRVGELLNRFEDSRNGLGQQSRRYPGVVYTTQEIASATRLRDTLKNVWRQMYASSGRTPGAFNMGYIANYFPNMEALVAGNTRMANMLELVRSEFESGFWRGAYELFKEPERYEGGVPSAITPPEPTVARRTRPFSQYLKRRSGMITEEMLELDPARALVPYIESAGRVIHDRRAVLESEQLLENLPKNDLWRQLADSYLDHIAGGGRSPTHIERIFRGLTQGLKAHASRIFINFNPAIQVLHLMRLPINAFPEMEGAYFKAGLAEVAKNPIGAYEKALDAGLLPQGRPWELLRTREKVGVISNYLGIADFIDRAVVFEGQKLKYLDSGLPMEQATTMAARDSARISFLASQGSRENAPMLFKSGASLQDSIANLSTQYKYIPVSMLHQLGRIVVNAQRDPAALAKATLGLATAYGIYATAGVRTIHFGTNLFSIEAAGTAFGRNVMIQLKAASAAYKAGDERRFHEHLVKAAQEMIFATVPGGNTWRNLHKYGLQRLAHEMDQQERARIARERERERER